MSALEHVTPSVVRIPLPLPINGLDSVNCYAVLGSDGVTVIDPGWWSPPNAELLKGHLATLGFGLGDVTQVLATHAHWDHYSQAVAWQREHGIPVLLGRGERESIRDYATGDGPSWPHQEVILRRCGAVELADEVSKIHYDATDRAMPFGDPDAWLDGGEVIDAGGCQIRAVATPGHTRGHVVFEEARDGLVFTGDHILPRITPSIAFERVPEDLPLRSYLGSLQISLDRPDGTQLPAHGAITPSVHERATQLLAHHDERLGTISELVAQGASTAHEVARQMRWTRRNRSLVELGTVHAMTAVLEVKAHLDLLVATGRLSVETGDTDVFTLTVSV